MQIEQKISAAPSCPVGAKPSGKISKALSEPGPLPPIAEYSPSENRSSIRFDLPPNSTSSLSNISSLIGSVTNEKARNPTPCNDLDILRSLHKRTKRKRKLKKFCRVFRCMIFYGFPIGGLILGIAGIILGHFLRIEPIFVGSCLLLIAAFGIILQSCFWRRSLPNKFHAKEIAFNMPQEDSLISQSDEQSEQEIETRKISGTSNIGQVAKISATMNPAQVRRLSMALNRATAELTAARQISSVGGTGSGVLNLARRLTMAPMQFGEFGEVRGFDSGNGWIAGRFPHGVRRGLAWNDTGASRFYASNYD